MSPLIISFSFCIIYLIQITILFNVFCIDKRAKFMIKLWFINLPILIMCCFTLDRYTFFSNDYIVGGFSTNLFLTVIFYVAGFYGGILQLYNLADRGLSLRILIDMKEKNEFYMTLDEIMNSYSHGKGISWMYQKRLDDMRSNGLIVISTHTIENTVRGMLASRLFVKLRKIVNL